LAGTFAFGFVAVFGYFLYENFSYNAFYTTALLFFTFLPSQHWGCFSGELRKIGCFFISHL